MHGIDVGERVPYDRGDPFFQTTPAGIDKNVGGFGHQLGGLIPAYVPVRPAPWAENGMCQLNVAAQVDHFGGRVLLGWAIWASRVVLLAEFHAVWLSLEGEMVDVTPAAEDEDRIVFAPDWSYPADFDFARRPSNQAMNIVPRSNPEAIAKTIDAFSPTQRAYEERRAARKGVDLAAHLAAKTGPAALATAVDGLIRNRQAQEKLVVPTTSRYVVTDPKAFMTAQKRIDEFERTIRRLLADAR